MAEPNATQSASHFSSLVKSPRSKRWAGWTAGLVLAFGVFGYLLAPPLLKSLLLNQLAAALHREVAIERIDINPYALSARISGFSVKAGDGREVVGFDELFVNLSSASIFKLAAVIDEFRLQGPRVSVVRQADGRYDISDLLDEWMKPKDEPDTGTPRFSLNNIQVSSGRLTLEDQPKGRTHTVTDLVFSLPFISSLPYQAEITVEPGFSAIIDGALIVLGGQSKPFSGTHESELALDLDHFDLAGLQPYLPDSLPLRLNSGTLDSELKVMFREVSDQVYSLDVVGALHVSGLSLGERSGQPLLGWKQLDIELEHLDPLNRKLTVSRIALDGPLLDLAVSRQGELNVLALAGKMAGGPAAPDTAPKSGAAPEWSLGEFSLTGGKVRWKDESNAPAVTGEIRNLQLVSGKLDSRLSGPVVVREASYELDFGEALQTGRMDWKDIRVDLAGRRIDIGQLSNGQLRARLTRNPEGVVEWLAPPQLRAGRPAPAAGKTAPEKPWVAQLARLELSGMAVRFEDQATRPAAIQEIGGLSLRGENLGNVPGTKGRISLDARVNEKGSFHADGSVQAQPLDLALKLESVAIPVMPLQPYFGEYLNIALTRGLFSNKGEATVGLDRGKLRASYKGSLTLGDFLAVDKLNSADFLKWKSLYVGGIDFRFDPMAVNVGEIALSDFYSRLILNQEGRLNVADIVRRPEGEAPPADAPKAAVKTEPAKEPLPIRIARITLQNGTVNFSDFFVKPNYTVNLTRLGGRVSGLSSAEGSVADMEIRGNYANTAPVQIMARLNPLAARSYLDLKADITGVDLVGFSPYAGKYAGYAIEKGKLSLNVAYKLENRQLTADNRLFIDQFTFGDKVDSPDATKLPVNLAIALLKNNRGEIDLNLPISGSLEDPQFSVGGLIVKVIVNLFVKAVTSPFALLGSIFGGGEELSNVEFPVGRHLIDAGMVKKLEAMSKALHERNSLKLEVTGRADPEADREGLRRVAVERAMKAEKLKDGLKQSGEGVSLDSIEIAPAEYETYLTRAYKAAKFPKPRNVIGLQKDLPVEEMEKLMLTNLPATDEDVRALAVRRAETVQGWLVEQGKVPLERIFLLPPKVEATEKGSASRVDFSLR